MTSNKRHFINWGQRLINAKITFRETQCNPQCFHLPPWRFRDFFNTPLDHYLTLGQQVVFQSLKLQEVPISPQRLSSRSYQQVNHQKSWGLTWVKLTTEPATNSTPIQMLFVFPGLTYVTTNHKDQSRPACLKPNLAHVWKIPLKTLFSY